MIRNVYNPFADPILLIFILMIVGFSVPIRLILRALASYFKVWEINADENMKIDVGAINRLDKENNMRRMVRQIQSNPFRHKFLK